MRYFEFFEEHNRTNEPESKLDQSTVKDAAADKKVKKQSNSSRDVISKYKRTTEVDKRAFRSKLFAERFKKKEKVIRYAEQLSARTEILNVEEGGYVHFDEKEEESINLTQQDILEQCDFLSAQKSFTLSLDKFGPYRVNFTRNGRHLLIAGKLGHIAAFDWQTKKLHTEINVMETVRDAKWLHLETFFVVAQKQWTYVYDNQGIEIHCLKALDHVMKLEFLPYHFLLASINNSGFLHYLDISTGKQVMGILTGLGFTDAMTHDPTNGVVALGHKCGVVSLWSPNVQGPIVKMLCHRNPIRSVAINITGDYLATSGTDPNVKIWDLRNLKILKSYRIPSSASDLCYSQKGLLSVSMNKNVAIFKSYSDSVEQPYFMLHREVGCIANCHFCPFEDVLGVGHSQGITSLLIPGAGEPNFDTFEANPYQTKHQRKQWEVKALLDKVQPDLISRDPDKLAEIDIKSLHEVMEERKKLLFLKPKKIAFKPRYRMKGRSKTGRKETRKRAVREAAISEFVKSTKVKEIQSKSTGKFPLPNVKKFDALDRFGK